MAPRQSFLFLITLNLATFGITFWASVYNPNLLQYKLSRLADPSITNTLLGLFAAAGLVVATLAQPLMGTLSDRTESRLGRRAPFLAVGALGTSLAVVILIGAPSLWVLLLGGLFGQLASNTLQGPFQALGPDQVPDSQKGLSGGVLALIQLVAVIASGVAVARLLATDQLTTLAAMLVSAILVSTLITLLRTPDHRYETAPDDSRTDAVAPRSLRSFSRELFVEARYRNLRWWLVNRFLFWGGLIGLRQFIINYLQAVQGYTNSEAIARNGEFTILLGLGVAVVTIPAGMLSDRVGRVRLIAFSCGVAFVGALLLIVTPDPSALRLVAVGVGAGAGIYFSVSWGLVTSLVPLLEAALFLGIANIATTLGSTAGQLGGPLIDLINHNTGSNAGYYVVFGLAASFFLLSLFAILRIKEDEKLI